MRGERDGDRVEGAQGEAEFSHLEAVHESRRQVRMADEWWSLLLPFGLTEKAAADTGSGEAATKKAVMQAVLKLGVQANNLW